MLGEVMFQPLIPVEVVMETPRNATPGFRPLGITPSVLCARRRGLCGATEPLYLFESTVANGEWHIGHLQLTNGKGIKSDRC